MILNEPLKALSWREPYGSLMLPTINKVETRSWPTKYRGLVLMCGSKKAYPWDVVRRISGQEQFDRILKKCEERGHWRAIDGFAYSIGRLVDCKPFPIWARETSISEIEDRTFVKYHHELHAHFYEEVKLIKLLPWKGSQGFRNVPQEFIDKIELA